MLTVEKVGPANLAGSGIGCLTSAKNQGYQPKVEWLQERFASARELLEQS